MTRPLLAASDHQRLVTAIGGWPAGVTTYRVGERWVCVIDNVEPGAAVARGRGTSREEALAQAEATATKRLASTRRVPL